MDENNKPAFQRFIFLSITLVAVGITMTAVLENMKPMGTVLIAIGGLFLIIGMKKKKDEDKNNDKE